MTTAFQRVESSTSTSTSYSSDHQNSNNSSSLQSPFRWNKSRKEIYDDSIGYLFAAPPRTRKERMLELLLSVACLIIGHFGPQWWISRNDNAWQERLAAPYQETVNGDVLIQLGLHYDVVQNETVPVWLLLVLTLIIPILLLPMVATIFGPVGDAHAISCVYGWAVGLNWIVTDVLKVYCGQLRPNFYQLCNFDADQKECSNQHTAYNAYKSFPSGHASLSFCSMTIVSLYWLGKVLGGGRVLHYDGSRRRRRRCALLLRTKILALLAFVLPMGVAIWIAASRVHDHYHHPADVVTGAIIGTTCAQFCMALYYPSSSSSCSMLYDAEGGTGYPLQHHPHDFDTTPPPQEQQQQEGDSQHQESSSSPSLLLVPTTRTAADGDDRSASSSGGNGRNIATVAAAIT